MVSSGDDGPATLDAKPLGAGAGRPDRAGSLGAQRGVGGPECVSPPHVRAKRRRGRRVLIGTSFEASLVGLLAGVAARGSARAVDWLPRPDQWWLEAPVMTHTPVSLR